MTMTDPIADMFSRIRNANNAQHDTVDIPSSKEKVEIARILKEQGFIDDFESTENELGHQLLRVTLRYGQDRSRTIKGLRRISKPGNRVYAKSTKLPKVLGGMGVAILSTSSGLMSDRDARRQKVGGEVVGYVW
jgi:small subunit ribosomal protein S8